MSFGIYLCGKAFAVCLEFAFRGVSLCPGQGEGCRAGDHGVGCGPDTVAVAATRKRLGLATGLLRVHPLRLLHLGRERLICKVIILKMSLG